MQKKLHTYNLMSVPGIILTLVFAVHAANHPEEFGLQEEEGQILGHVLDCNMLDECEDLPGKICASDGKTYPSLCRYMRAYCEQKEIEFKHHDECTASEKCLGQRKFALKKTATESGHYIPTCKKDGTFTAVQCHKDINVCWCSTPAGESIPGTDVHNKTPLCDDHTGPSSSGHSTKGSSSDRSKGGCVGARRKTFNNKMMQKMVTDFARSHANLSIRSGKELQTDAVKWKFSLLDSKKDGQLRKKEYKGIQKLVRGNLQPKQCARKFPKFCDENNDKKITLEEWMKCFSVDDTISDAYEGRKVPNAPGKHGAMTSQMSPGFLGKRLPNCERDKHQATEHEKNGNMDVYIPKCDNKGRYWPVQCYGSTKQWYCFCVNIITGDMIPNTSVQNVSPVCNKNILPNEWPKCPPPDKEKKFLKQLLDFFTNYAKNNVSKKYENKINSKGDKRILEKIFKYLDINKNGELDGRERKNLKNLIKSGKNLWLCGKRIHKVCDIDSDNKISLQEFFTCVLPRKIVSNTNSVVDQPSPGNGGNSRRPKGQNPFIELIKPEQRK